MVYIVELESSRPDPARTPEGEYVAEVRRLNEAAYEEFRDECFCTFMNCKVYGFLPVLGAVVAELPEFEVEPVRRMHSVRDVRPSLVHKHLCSA
jgi:hypothetical protein